MNGNDNFSYIEKASRHNFPNDHTSSFDSEFFLRDNRLLNFNLKYLGNLSFQLSMFNLFFTDIESKIWNR